MNLADIRYARMNSALARRLLALCYRAGQPYRLPFGPLRGLRMCYDLSVNFHAILGLWEAETFDLLAKIFVRDGILPKDSIVADVGGNIGYYTLWFSTIAVNRGYVYSFEPSPQVLQFFRNNLKLNNITNAEIVELACGDHVGKAEFYLAEHHHASSLHADWASRGHFDAHAITVPVTTLDEFFAPKTNRRAPTFIKIDIEGGGTHALPGCQRILRETRPFLLIESHTPDEDQAISSVLCNFNYHGYRLNNKKWVQNSQTTYPDEDGVWGNLLLIPDEKRARIAALVDEA